MRTENWRDSRPLNDKLGGRALSARAGHHKSQPALSILSHSYLTKQVLTAETDK